MTPKEFRAQQRVLGRAYPLLKRAAELLELEGIEPQATRAKRLRQEVAVLLRERPGEKSNGGDFQ